MTSILWLRALPAPYETPLGNAARNAVLNHQLRGVSAFCTDLGLDYVGLRDCDPAAVAALANLIGVPPSAFDSGIIRRDGHNYTIRGERLLKHSLRRDRIHVCPACLAGDIAQSSHPPAAAACCRSHWQLDAVRCCPEHELELIEIPPADLRARDFAALVEPHLADLGRLPFRPISRSMTAFQQYLIARLDKDATPVGLLDELEFHAASRLCEMLGASLCFEENRKLETLSNRDWLTAGEAGFSFACEGREGVRAALREFQRRYTNYSKSGNDGPQAIFGRFFKWAAFNCEGAAYSPIRDILHEHIVATMPIEPGTILLGRAVERRKIHSVRSASQEIGAHPKQLRKILRAIGALSPLDDDKLNALAFFDADQYADTLEDIRDAMPLRLASEYLGAGRVHGKLLFDRGFIRPFVRKSIQHTIQEHLFSKRELDGFLSRLFERADTANQPDSETFVSMPTAAKRANCSSTEIIDLVINGEIDSRRLPGPPTFMALLVNYEEVRSKVRGEYAEEVTAREASVIIRTTDGAVKALIDGKIFPTRTMISPKNRCPVQVIPISAIEEFRKTYCTSAEISRDIGIGPRAIERIARQNGINPELQREKYRVSFYRRSDLAGMSFK